MRRSQPLRLQQLSAWYLIIHRLSPAHTNGRHLFPRLCLQGAPAHSSTIGSSCSLRCLGRGKLSLMITLVERTVSPLGSPLLTPWRHHLLQRSRRPKEPARLPSEQAKLGWYLRKLPKKAWGQRRSQLHPSTSCHQVSLCLSCLDLFLGDSTTIDPLLPLRHLLINKGLIVLGLCHSVITRKLRIVKGLRGDDKDAIDREN